MDRRDLGGRERCEQLLHRSRECGVLCQRRDLRQRHEREGPPVELGVR